jgi:hypothetical protein
VKSQKPEFVPAKSRFLRRKRVLKGVRDVERGAKDTERRGAPSDLPASAASRRSRNGRV